MPDQELRQLQLRQVHLSKRQDTLRIVGKHNKVRKVPLNVTARAALSSSEGTSALNPEDDTEYLS